jgi:hypothetical protein
MFWTTNPSIGVRAQIEMALNGASKLAGVLAWFFISIK